MNKARAYFKVLLFALWSLPLVTAQCLVLLVTTGKWAYKIPRFWHAGLCKIFDIHIRVTGTPHPTTTPVMFISNHVSYLDILAFGSIIEASFVAKNDVATWPIFGFLANLQQTAYISRASKDALKEKHSLQSYLHKGKSIILFPEGTTGDGKTILPFKSSLFSLALEHGLTNGTLMIQPFTLRISPKPGSNGAETYAWAFFDETPMVKHLMRFAAGTGCTLEIIFHAPVDPKNYTDRKVLCKTVEKMIVDGHASGRVQQIPTLTTE